MSHFTGSIFVTVLCTVLAYMWGGFTAALTTVLLGILEISLSFDNAVVNASILKHWDAFWRKLFLTVGILVAVFGMRLVFPLVIVSFTTSLGMYDAAVLALENPQEYSKHLGDANTSVSAFGGMFLLMVFLKFMLDDDKEIHWLTVVEKRLAKLGRLDSISIFIALLALVLMVNWFVPEPEQFTALFSGAAGLLTYVAVDLLGNFFEDEGENDAAVADVVKKGSVAGFIYLEVLDASFSFDGVIGAFAITKDVVIIMLGLSIGAMFVRSITVFLVEKGTLDEYVFLEHGAHWAIAALSGIMLIGMSHHVPEWITGLIGVAFILMSVWSSLRYRKQHADL